MALGGCFSDNPAWLGLSDGASGSGGESGGPDPAAHDCDPLEDPPADAVVVAAGEDLAAAVAAAGEGATLVLADGTYAVGQSIALNVPGVTLRSMSGNAGAVVIDGGALAEPIVVVGAPDCRIAEVTITGGAATAVQIRPSGPGSDRVSIYGVQFVDAGTTTVDTVIADGAYVETGRVECSTFRRTAFLEDAAACAVDTALAVRGGRGWLVRSNTFERYGCRTANAATVALREGARDSVVVRNRFVNCNRALLIGNEASGSERAWGDVTCIGEAPWGHVGGLVANNTAWVGDPQTVGDSMFSFWSACDARAYHNTAVMIGDAFNGVEYRFANTDVRVFNNLTSHPISARDGGQGVVEGNIELADRNDFVDAVGGDVHLLPGAAAIGAGLRTLDEDVGVDIDGDPRDEAPDAGADEYVP